MLKTTSSREVFLRLHSPKYGSIAGIIDSLLAAQAEKNQVLSEKAKSIISKTRMAVENLEGHDKYFKEVSFYDEELERIDRRLKDLMEMYNENIVDFIKNPEDDEWPSL